MKELNVEIAVLGSGPGGYTAAFRAADLLKKPGQVALIERYPDLGGVCLNIGCIPSKTLLHVSETIRSTEKLKTKGLSWDNPVIDLAQLRAHKKAVVGQLTSGLSALAKARQVNVLQGTGILNDPHSLIVTPRDGEPTKIIFKKLILAVGSRPIKLPFLPTDSRIVDSTGALNLPFIPKKMLVIGGGIIGMEMASIYSALGSKITIVELGSQLIPSADEDIVKPLVKFAQQHYESILMQTKVKNVIAKKEGLLVSFEGVDAPKESVNYDMILSAVGRRPNGDLIGLEKAGLSLNQRGFIEVDDQQRTVIEHIFAIGDCASDPMLAHKAIPEGKVAAEVACGLPSAFLGRLISSVAYTDPEIAWVGQTERQLKKDNIPYEKSVFPWAANGRSLALGRQDGLTKLLFDPKTKHILGAGIAGPHAGDLIAEITLAIEMGCVAEDLALTIHPHPTLSETIAQSCEAFEGTITDLMPMHR
jgi:dihydrolipoamide dehydrogenase